MPTQKQHDANLRNAQFSTGPNSPTGKAASSQNSFKHGVCVSDLNLFNDLETEAGFQGRLTEYLDHHQPATPDERDAIEDIVLTRVRANLYDQVKTKPGKNGDVLPYFSVGRVPPHERRILSNRHLGTAWERVAQTIDRLSRYEARLAARLEKSKRELAALQSQRQHRQETLPEPPQPTMQNEPNSDLTPAVATPVPVLATPLPASGPPTAPPADPPTAPPAPAAVLDTSPPATRIPERPL